jgi:hypothetical protein
MRRMCWSARPLLGLGTIFLLLGILPDQAFSQPKPLSREIENQFAYEYLVRQMTRDQHESFSSYLVRRGTFLRDLRLDRTESELLLRHSQTAAESLASYRLLLLDLRKRQRRSPNSTGDDKLLESLRQTRSTTLNTFGISLSRELRPATFAKLRQKLGIE